MRVDEWDVKLMEYVESMRNIPFEYGENDCCTFVGDCLKAMTNIDIVTEFRGTYDGSTVQTMLDQFGGSVEGWADNYLDPIALVDVARGDVVMLDTPFGPCLAVSTGRYAAVMTQTGANYIFTNYATKAWAGDLPEPVIEE